MDEGFNIGSSYRRKVAYVTTNRILYDSLATRKRQWFIIQIEVIFLLVTHQGSWSNTHVRLSLLSYWHVDTSYSRRSSLFIGLYSSSSRLSLQLTAPFQSLSLVLIEDLRTELLLRNTIPWDYGLGISGGGLGLWPWEKRNRDPWSLEATFSFSLSYFLIPLLYSFQTFISLFGFI